MPNAKDNAKLSGDVHPPEVEDAPGSAGDPLSGDDDASAPAGRGLEDEARPGKGENQAGFLKDKDAPGSTGSERKA
jgi:hypothetical protein